MNRYFNNDINVVVRRLVKQESSSLPVAVHGSKTMVPTFMVCKGQQRDVFKSVPSVQNDNFSTFNQQNNVVVAIAKASLHGGKVSQLTELPLESPLFKCFFGKRFEAFTCQTG